MSSRPNPSDNLPPTARSVALLLASTPNVQDAHPGVLHQLLEFAHRYTTQVLGDAQVYAEHAGRGGKLEMDDVTLAIQARVGWEFGGRVPKEYILSLASQTNAIPLPAVPEVFGVRLPPASETLTAVNFDLVPNKPPPGVKIFDEEVEEIEESETSEEEEDEEDDDMEMVPGPNSVMHPAVVPFQAAQTPSDVEMHGTPGGAAGGDDRSEPVDDDDLFGEDDDEDGMEEVQTAPTTNGIKRKLVEEDDYD